MKITNTPGSGKCIAEQQMIDHAKKDFDIDLQRSFVVGDMDSSDMILAKNIGAKPIVNYILNSNG